MPATLTPVACAAVPFHATHSAEVRAANMNDVVAPIAEVVGGFHRRIDDLKRLMTLRNCPDNIAYANEFLQDLSTIVGELEAQAASMRDALEAERAALAQAEALLPLMQAQKLELDHMEQNLPRHLPGTHAAQRGEGEDAAAQGGMVRPAQSQPTARPIASILGDKSKEAGASAAGAAPPAKSAKDLVASQLPRLEYVTVDEFESVPKYMRGRMKRDAINQVIDIIHTAVAAKYKILATPRRQLGENALKKLKDYRAAENEETAREFFFVEDDLKLDGAGKGVAEVGKIANTLVVLRHLGRLREHRGGGHLRFVLCRT